VETPLLKPPGFLLVYLAMLSMIGLFLAALVLAIGIIGLLLYFFFIRRGE
jgi:hypothetical protein